MQRCCKITFANFGFCVPAAKLHFHKQMYFLDLFHKKKKKKSRALKIATFQQEERQQHCNYLHGFIQFVGKEQLFVFKALNWSKRKTELISTITHLVFDRWFSFVILEVIHTTKSGLQGDYSLKTISKKSLMYS